MMACTAVGAPLLAQAQQAPRIPVIGFLHPGFPDIAGTNPAAAALRKSLRQFGFIDGETIKI